MLRKSVLLAALLAAVALPTPAAAQDDAGSGGDAGGSAASALAVPPGTFAGQLSLAQGDTEDWYWFDVPARFAAHVTLVVPEGGPCFRFLDADLQPVPYSARFCYAMNHNGISLGVSDGRGLYLVFDTDGSRTQDAYEFTWEMFGLPDLVLSAAETTPAPGAPLRTFHLAVRNDGAGAARVFASLSAYADRPLYTAVGCSFASEAVLEPGAAWDADARLVVAGDAEVHAGAAGWLYGIGDLPDLHPEDNRAAFDTTGPVPLGQGAVLRLPTDGNCDGSIY
jgi:hypothetical protein